MLLSRCAVSDAVMRFGRALGPYLDTCDAECFFKAARGMISLRTVESEACRVSQGTHRDAQSMESLTDDPMMPVHHGVSIRHKRSHGPCQLRRHLHSLRIKRVAS